MIPKDEKEALEFLKKEVGDDYVPWHLERTFRLMNQKERECVRRLIRKFTEMIPADFSPKQKAALLFEILVKRGTYVDEEIEKRFVYVINYWKLSLHGLFRIVLYSLLQSWNRMQHCYRICLEQGAYRRCRTSCMEHCHTSGIGEKW